MRTPEAYRESLRRGRRLMVGGARVADVDQHPVLRKVIDHAFAEGPADRAPFAADDGGEPVARFHETPEVPAAVLRRMWAIDVAPPARVPAAAVGTAEERLRVLYPISDLAVSERAGCHAARAVYAEGPLEAEKLAAARHFGGGTWPPHGGVPG